MILYYNSHGQVGTGSMVYLSHATLFIVAGGEECQNGGEWDKLGNCC